MNEETLKVIEEMAQLFFSANEIECNIEQPDVDINAQVQSRCGPIYEAYMRGRLKGEIALRKGIHKAAENGSNPAQAMLLEISRKSKIIWDQPSKIKSMS